MWKCSAPDAPYPYQNFNLLIDTVLGKYTGKIFGEGNVEVPINTIILKDSIFEISLNIENTSVNLKLKWDGIKLKGAAVSEQGDIAITGERIEVNEKKSSSTDTIPANKK